MDQNNQHMQSDLAKAIIASHLEKLDADNDKFIINYFGGEPTVNDEALLAAINFLIETDINCEQNLLTNGIFNQKLLTRLCNKDLSFQVSFDGKSNNLRFNKNLTKELSNPTIETIKTLAIAKERIHIRATIHQDNVNNMLELVQFCEQHAVTELKIAPICEFGDVNVYKIKQPNINVYVDNYYQAYEYAERCGVYMKLRNWNTKLQKIMTIPMIWLPDGYVAMTITYASSRIKGAEQIIIGKYSNETNKIELDQDKIQQMKINFIVNRKKYCSGCPLEKNCAGLLQFTPFATNTFIPERDSYFCDIEIKLAQF
jgi:sulfatase maturation enzyme AslB (radical SAM superfamily)